MNKPSVGYVYLFPNGTFVRLTKVAWHRKSKYNQRVFKLRCIRPVVGTKRPYTYQRWCNEESFKKAKLIGTEQILLALFQQRENKSKTKLYR